MRHALHIGRTDWGVVGKQMPEEAITENAAGRMPCRSGAIWSHWVQPGL